MLKRKRKKCKTEQEAALADSWRAAVLFAGLALPPSSIPGGGGWCPLALALAPADACVLWAITRACTVHGCLSMSCVLARKEDHGRPAPWGHSTAHRFVCFCLPSLERERRVNAMSLKGEGAKT